MRWLLISEINLSHRERLYDRLDEEGIDAYYTNALMNLRYLIGFCGTTGGLLIYSNPDRGTELFVDGRYRNYAEGLQVPDLSVELVEDSRETRLNQRLESLDISSLHLERSNLTYDQFLAFRETLSYPDEKEYGNDWVIDQRQTKSDEALENISEAIEQTLDVFRLVETWLEPGLSEKSLSRSIRRELESRSEGLAFDPLVLSGENVANPHSPPSNRELREDDWLLVDQGVRINGYCSDLTRMFFLGNPDPEIRNLYELSRKAAAKAFSIIQAGVAIEEIVEVAHDVIREAGYEDNLRHGLGHGVGLNVHESPSLSAKSNDLLEPGMVVTLEPGIYIDGFGGGRVEHMVYVQEDGARLLDTADEYLKEEL